jgi:hypothetical protein
MIIQIKANANNYLPNAESLIVLGLPAHYSSTQSLLNAELYANILKMVSCRGAGMKALTATRK